jgi:ABC-type sugar transport system ATPase subunit
MPIDNSARQHPAEHRPPVLEVRELSKTYPGTKALDRISLSLAANEILGLAGHNGAGKSTLTRLLAGAEKPDSGEILLSGQNVHFRSPDEAMLHGVALVPQPLMVVPNLTGRENLLLGMHSRLMKRGRGRSARSWFGEAHSAAEAVEAMAAHLHLLDYLDIKVDRTRPVTQRLLMIGRALLRNPRLIILDEPTANLPRPEVDLLFSILRPLARSSASVIYITHRLEEMLELSDRIIVMRQGGVIAEKAAQETSKGDLSALIAGADLKSRRSALLGGVNILDRIHVSEPSVDRAKSLSAGAEVLRCENLCAAPRTRDVNLTLRRGEVLGIAGLDGSGRTSLLRALWGDRPLTGGRILVRGEVAEINNPRDAIRVGIAYLPEERTSSALFRAMTVAENATLPRLSRFVGRLGLVNGRSEANEVSALLQRLDLRPLKGAARAKVRTFSGGNQQKVIIARWLLGSADIFMFDEPTQGIDVGAREQVYEVIRELAANDAGVIIVSSEAEELARLCSRVHVMRDGAIVQTLTGDQVTEAVISRATVEGAVEDVAA